MAKDVEVVTALERHFCPARVDSIADHSTLATAYAVVEPAAEVR